MNDVLSTASTDHGSDSDRIKLSIRRDLLIVGALTALGCVLFLSLDFSGAFGAHEGFPWPRFGRSMVLTAAIILVALTWFSWRRGRELARINRALRSAQKDLDESQHRYSSLVEQAGVSVTIDDTQGSFRYFNATFAELFGYSAEEMSRNTHHDIVHPEDLDTVNQLHLARISGDQVQSRYEFRGMRKDGSTVFLEVYSVPLIENGRAVGTFSYLWEVTERKRSEEATRVAFEAAETARHAKARFLANMSHELRTPLNSIIGNLDLALASDLSARQRAQLARSRRSAADLTELISDILDYTQLQAGQYATRSDSFTLRKTFDTLIQPLVSQAEHRGLEMSWSVHPKAPDELVGNVEGLGMVLNKLVHNAIKFTDRGKITVRASLEQARNTRALLHFAVSDTGIGISKEHLRTIFSAFTQVDDSASRRYDGPGLGLAIASQIVDSMGGRIWAESEPGKGSTFHFTAPFSSV